MTEPTVDVPSDDDNTSVASRASSTNQPISCPFCTWSKQQRYLFKHIVQNHYPEIYTAVGTAEKIRADLAEKNLLRLNISVYAPDDEFHEFDKTPRAIYGCLGDDCYKTFEQSGRALAHWKKSKKCHQSHLRKVNVELKKIEKFDKSKEEDWTEEFSEQQFIFLIEKFKRYHYRLMVEDIPYLLSLPMNTGKTMPPEYYQKYSFKEIPTLKGKKKLQEEYKKYNCFIHKLTAYVANNYTPPFDWRYLNPYELTEPYEEAGLLPVGASYEEYKQKRLAESQTKAIQETKQQEDAFLKRIEAEKRKILEQLKKESEENRTTLATIAEVPVKVKRNSFTIPRPDMVDLMLRSPSPARAAYPQIISNTKKMREPKRPPPA